MSIKEIARAKKMRPFMPFRIHLTSGVTLAINDEARFAVDTGKRMVFVFAGEEYHLLSASEIAALTFRHGN